MARFGANASAQVVQLVVAPVMTNRMLDVDFLLNPIPFDRHVIYRFRTGALRRHLRDALIRVSKPMVSADLDTQNILQGGSGLFADDYISYINLSPSNDPCGTKKARKGAARNPNRALVPLELQLSGDLNGSATRRLERQRADQIVAALAGDCENPAVIFAREDHLIFRHLEWVNAQAKCLLIEEVVPTKSTIQSIIAFLEQDTDLLPEPSRRTCVARTKYLRESFERGVEDRIIRSLRDAIHEFDRVVLLHSDRDTGKFVGPSHLAENGGAPELDLFAALRQFVGAAENQPLAAVLQRIDGLHRDAADARFVVEKLCRATIRLMSLLSNDRAAGRPLVVNEMNLIIWICTLLVWAEILIENGDREARDGAAVTLFVVRTEQLLQEFLSRAGPGASIDPMHDRWRELTGLYSSSTKREGSFDRLLRDFGRFVAARSFEAKEWLKRLESVTALGKANNQAKLVSPPTIVTSQPEIGPTSFDEVYGNATVVSQLRERFRRGDHSSPILFYGPAGVGKDTLSRIYARTFLCYDRPARSDKPCGKCAPCRALENDMGFIDFDPAEDQDGSLGRKVSARIEAGLYPHHRAVIVKNAALGERTLDALLDKLETLGEDTVILLNALDLNAVTPTALSRCKVHRLRQLSRSDSRSLLIGKFEALGRPIPESRSLAVMIAASDGLPARLSDMVRNVADVNATSFQEIVAALGYDWVDWAFSFWSLMSNPTQPSTRQLRLAPGFAAAKAVEYARRGLSIIHPSSELPEAVRLTLSEDDLSRRARLVASFTESAKVRGLTAEALWGRVVRLWISDDEVDAAGFTAKALATWHLLR